METFSPIASVREAALSNAFASRLSSEALHAASPAVFAPCAHERTGRTYTFISTERVLKALESAGFMPVAVRQARTRTLSTLHARHVVRLRRRFETVELREAVPEIVLINSHDGRCAYQLYYGLYRAICTNGMIVSAGTFASFRVAHRGEVIDDLVCGALQMCERFTALAEVVQRMEAKRLAPEARLHFAQLAQRIRYPDVAAAGMPASELLKCRRPQDDGDDLWRTFNVVQENLLRGGLPRRSSSGRLVRTRRITSIREDVRINSQLWSLATSALAA